MSLLDAIEIETAPQPSATVIVLHGLGADGNDFVPIASQLRLQPVGPVRFVFPHAPVMPVTINNGYRMRAWYDILGADLVRREDEAGLRSSLTAVEALLAREKSRGMPASRIVLAGFSQGCAMALLTGLRHAERLAGIVGLSGYVPLAATTTAERSDANALTPIFMAHGTYDNVVAPQRGRESCELLRAMGYDVSWHEYPMAHSVCLEEIEDLNAWLLKVLARD
ncbi:alpha/beta hydrolase [Ramlibacter henchirensis]|jgi:phospholipase/carboxylesterase|uniref:Alpha/beta hydrolase n=1 Tax=Ramlibacter henchirensis TaxID=204072 RepID=A0A4Z0BVH4_9BURK|nr:alpha/beta hydrolase [Ramlibacter henchirensis]TFZ02370.1 alpha/beta hydrolase [Ramlibacter henchirensis]